MNAHQQVGEDDAAGGEGEARRHVDHRPLAGGNARLAHDGEAVRDGLDARVRSGAQRVGAQEEQGEGHCSHGRDVGVQPRRDAPCDVVHPSNVEPDAPGDEHGVGDEEGQEDRQKELDRLLDAAEVEDGEQHQHGHFDGELPDVPVVREVAEDRFPARGHRGGGGEHVVDEQRRAADDAGARAEQLRGDGVSASAEGEVLDDLRIGGGDDEDGDAGRDGEEHRQVLVAAEVLEGFLGTIGRGAEAVGAEPDPGEEGRQRDVLEELRILDVLRPAEQCAGELLPSRRRKLRFLIWLGGRGDAARRRGRRTWVHDWAPPLA